MTNHHQIKNYQSLSFVFLYVTVKVPGLVNVNKVLPPAGVGAIEGVPPESLGASDGATATITTPEPPFFTGCPG
jgi:hypothetical protein